MIVREKQAIGREQCCIWRAGVVGGGLAIGRIIGGSSRLWVG
jgi:hypothetical protein